MRALWIEFALPWWICHRKSACFTRESWYPVMFTLRVRRQLNALGAEALAVALLLPARLIVTTEVPVLHAAAEETGVGYQVLD
ncbi:MAG: hypothetical protein ACRDY2_03925 [Acidimicrobiales bacterium]